jgi:L,D-transpeptidase catalytic domain
MTHFVINVPSKMLKAYNTDGAMIFSCQARNDTVAGATYYHFGMCPPGEYTLDAPMPLEPPEVPFGAFFIPVNDVHSLWIRYDRSGIGIHGGGSGLADSFAPQQGWQITEGCFRLQNEDLAALVKLVVPGDRLTVFQGTAQ